MGGGMEIQSMNSSEILDNEPVEIIPGLYLGSCHASYNKDALNRLNVKYVVNCSGQESIYGDEFTYLHLYLRDREDYSLLSCFYYSIDFIIEGLNKGSVFVYCKRGGCRSVSIVAAFLMSQCHMSFSDTLYLLRERRPQMRINDAFLLQLRFFFECGCNFYLAYQLYLVHVLTRYNELFHNSGFLRCLQLYKSLKPAYAALCRPSQECCGLPLPACLVKKYQCKYCKETLFYARNLLDHQRVDLHDLSENKGRRTIHCSSEYIEKCAAFTKQHHSSFSDYSGFPSDKHLPISHLSNIYDELSPSITINQSSYSTAMSPLHIRGVCKENSDEFSHSKLNEECGNCQVPSYSHVHVRSQDLADFVSRTSYGSGKQQTYVPHFHCFSSEPSLDHSYHTVYHRADDKSSTAAVDGGVARSIFDLDLDPYKSFSNEAVKVVSRAKREPSIFDDFDVTDDRMLDSQIFSVYCSDPLLNQAVLNTDRCTSPLEDDVTANKTISTSLQEVERAKLIERVPLENCSDYFIEPVDWVVQQILDGGNDMGALHCPNPNCLKELGGYGFNSEHQCECGFSVPSYFYAMLRIYMDLLFS